MRVAIVGIGGVGMAHAIACEKVGAQVVAVLDSNPETERFLTARTWVNAWGGHREAISPKSKPKFTTDIVEFKKINADLLILATPTRTHVNLLCRLGQDYDRILVEKPLAYSLAELKKVPSATQLKTFVSHEWLLDPAFPKFLKTPFAMLIGHNYPPKEDHKKECGVVWDLGSHAVAHFVSRVPQAYWRGLEVRYHTCTPNHATFATHGWIEGVFHVAYETIGPGEVIVDDTVLHWTHQFEWQMTALMNNNHPVDWMIGQKVVDILSRIAPMKEVSNEPDILSAPTVVQGA